MGKDKLRRFAEFKTFSNTFDFAYDKKGGWNDQVFRNNHPIVLELGCGKGEYTVALAKEYPEKNFIGIDIKSNRMWKGAGIAQEEQLTNVAFLRAVIHRLTELFAPGEVSEIWITFPDPFPKSRHAKHRLTHPRFLSVYKEVLQPGGLLHLKTDDPDLFRFTVDMLPQTGVSPLTIDWDVHANANAAAHLHTITTHYEKLFMGRGRTIKYVQFTLDEYNQEKADRFEAELELARKSLAQAN